MPGWPPFIAAVFTAAFFLLLTVKWILPAALCGVVAVAAMLKWGWELDRGAKLAPVDIGGGIRLPAYASGPLSHAWWATIILILVIGTTYACLVFSYLYFWTVNPQLWPAADELPGVRLPLAAALCLVLASALVGRANRALGQDRDRVFFAALGVGLVLLLAAFLLELYAHRALSPSASSYGATVQTFVAINGVSAMAASLLAGLAMARRFAGTLDAERRNAFDSARLLWHYVVAQNAAGLALVHGFPRWVA
jgi:heme/copper-type cytochrome/quinol oxidase subunit 3